MRDLLGRMTLEEKFWQTYMSPGDLADTAMLVHGVMGLQVPVPGGDTTPGAARAHAARINALQRFMLERTRLGIPLIPFEETVHGLARGGATVFPAAIALAATWDTALMGRVAAAIAIETRTRGIRQGLSPVVNIASDARWGRVEETYGEDAVLSSAMARAFVFPFERRGVIATPKHFVANVGEGGRDSYPIEVSERRLAEVFFSPFRAAFAAGAGSVMTAYNSVDGDPATQSRRLLTGVLREAWGFRGFVISDAAATGGATVLNMTEPNTPTAAQHAFLSGLDVVFQSTVPQHRPYWEAVRTGMIPVTVLDSAVARVLRAKFSLGLFESPYVNEDSAAAARSAAHIALAREAARASIVLLRNEGGVLPLRRSLRRVAVIGADAVEARLGGYSAPGTNAVSIADGVRAALGRAATVRDAAGPGRERRTVVTVAPAQLARVEADGVPSPGVIGEYFDNIELAGSSRMTRTDPAIDFRWTLSGPARGFERDWYSVRWTGTLTVPEGRRRRVGVEGNDGWRLWIDDRLVIDRWRKQSYGATLAAMVLEPGQSYRIRLEYHETVGNARVRLVWDGEPESVARAAIDSAVAIARQSEVAIVVAGVEEGEFRDRAFLGLPGRQEELIAAVAATGTPTIVVLVGGSAITMPWLERVAGVLDAWYPGEQGGHAVADVLFGDANPAGRLPLTFAMAEGQLPLVYNHKPTGRGDDYVDLTGRPLFPFGFGLSYTTFAYSGLTITPTLITCTVRNTGTRAGDEVVQLYIRDVLASVARPVMQLAGFARIRLEPGESREVRFVIGSEQLGMLNREMQWVVEPGDFRILVGASSEDIRLRGTLTVR